MGFGIREHLGFRAEQLVLVGSRDLGVLDLGELIPQQVDLAGARPLVAAESSELGVDAADRAARLEQPAARRERDVARGAVEQTALFARREQRLVGVLTVEVDELAAPLRELGGRGQAAVHVAATAADGRHDARQHDFVVGVAIPEVR